MRAFGISLVLLAAALGAVPAKAERPEKGLYEGTIGTLPIRACFDESSTIAGTYYYLKHLKPIGLGIEDDNAGVLLETTGYEEFTGGQWWSLRQKGEAVTGLWRDGRRRLPIRLKQVLYTGPNYTGPCDSKQFQMPRLAGASVKESAAEFAGVPVTNLEFYPGPNFDAESVFILSFVIAGSPQPGDAVINANLRRVLPVGVDESDSGFLECMGMMNMIRGWDGNFEHVAAPEVLTKRWLGVLHTQGVYCGGAHPNYWQNRQIFDRQSGAEVDPVGWLAKGALQFYEYESVDNAGAKRPVQGLSDGVQALVRKYWPSDAEAECTDLIGSGMPGWDIGLGEGGMIFKPELPHVATACVESVTVPWGDLAPFLSEEGQAVRASLTR